MAVDESKEQFEVLENSGMYNETEVDTFDSLESAKHYVSKMYSKSEVQELNIDITCNGSTEY
jgi:hypothetical protein